MVYSVGLKPNTDNEFPARSGSENLWGKRRNFLTGVMMYLTVALSGDLWWVVG